ncbi:MAG TPA: hypothetical protein VIY72_07285 [Acidimicrobiales bacterium]
MSLPSQLSRPARRARRLVTVAALAGLLFVGCSSDGGDEDSSSSTSVDATEPSADTTTTVAPPSGSTATTPGSTEGSLPSSPSSLPAELTGACAPLAETYGIDALQPRDTSSWVDERLRVVVDARREADLLGAARSSMSPPIAGDVETLASYATFVADAVLGADSYGASVAAIDSGPDRGPVDAASTAVAAWRDVSC